MKINDGLNLIKGCVELLERAVVIFDDEIGKPEFIREIGRERFRYQKPSSQIFQVLKSVRVASAYNACLCLLRQGYCQETCALIRMVFEFLHDMEFIAESYLKGGVSGRQQEMLALFFKEDLPDPEEFMSRHNKRPTVPRRKVYAEVARGLSPENPDRTQRLIRLLEESYSGYVHAAYPHIMELYVGGVWRFSINGMAGTPRQFQALRAVVRSLSQALNQFAKLAIQFGKVELFKELIEKRKMLETSVFYRKIANSRAKVPEK